MNYKTNTLNVVIRCLKIFGFVIFIFKCNRNLVNSKLLETILHSCIMHTINNQS